MNRILNLIRQGLKFIQYCISYIIPKSDKIIIYGAWGGKNFSDNPKYVFLEAAKDLNYKNIWISKNKSVVTELKDKGYSAFYTFSARGIIYQLIAGKAVICVGYTDLCRPLISHKKVLQLWHGIPLKKIKYDVNPPGTLEKIQDMFFRDTRVLYTSQNYHEIYRRCFGKDDAHLFLCGQPRNDIFFDSSLIDSKMNEELQKIIGEKKMILYMPTHRKEGKEKLELEKHIDFERLSQICQNKKYVFVIKKHFYHLSEKCVQKFSNIIDISNKNFDSQFLLSQADMLITDYSSCYIDYLLREKPILFFQYDKEEYKTNERELYFDNDLVYPGYVVTTYDELEDALKCVADGLSEKYIDRIKLAKDFFYDPKCQGKTSDIVWEYIKRM